MPDQYRFVEHHCRTKHPDDHYEVQRWYSVLWRWIAIKATNSESRAQTWCASHQVPEPKEWTPCDCTTTPKAHP